MARPSAQCRVMRRWPGRLNLLLRLSAVPAWLSPAAPDCAVVSSSPHGAEIHFVQLVAAASLLLKLRQRL